MVTPLLTSLACEMEFSREYPWITRPSRSMNTKKMIQKMFFWSFFLLNYLGYSLFL